MRALIKTVPGVGNLSVMYVPAPVPSSGEAVVRVLRSGLCGTDLLVYDDTYRGRNRPVPYPLIPGHEASGEVVELGPDTVGPQPGTRVAIEAGTRNGAGFSCTRGHYNLFHGLDHNGFSSCRA